MLHRIFYVFAIMGLLGACSPQISVNSDYDDDIDFSEYQSFGWSDEIEKAREDGQPMIDNELVRNRIKESIKSEMESRGYTYDENAPDLEVNFHIVVEDRQEYRSAQGRGTPWGYGYWQQDDMRSTFDYRQGSLIIDLVDRENNQLIWQGYAEGIEKTNPQQNEKRLKSAIEEIFVEYDERMQ